MSTSKQRNKLLNLLMVVLAAVIVAAGVLYVLDMRGMLPSDADAAVFTTADKTGNVNIERNGTSYQLDEQVLLRADDTVETLSGSSIAAESDDKGAATFDERTKASVQSNGLSLNAGSLFCVVPDGQSLALQTSQTMFSIGAATVVVAAQTGVTQAFVLDGSVEVDGTTVPCGASITLSDGTGTPEVQKSFSAADLDDLMLEQVAQADKRGANLCLSRAAVKKEQRKREKAQAAASGATGSIETDAAKKADADQASESSSNGSSSDGDGQAGGGSDANGASAADGSATSTEADSDNATGETSAEAGASGASSKSASAKTKSQAKSAAKAKKALSHVTVEIRCDTILKHKKRLAAGKSKYVPANGTILKRTKVAIADGDTAFDVLKAACAAEHIQLDYRYTPVYATNYVEGINNLYEKDCGEQSGWIYKVNGWEPNVGASQYQVKNGDAIVWAYTCDGYGKDVA